jgi:hypothetical protein
MTTQFKANYNKDEAFALRADMLRPMFGYWDAEDVVSHCILDVVEAQRELNDMFADSAEQGLGSKAAFKAAFAKREAAAERLLDMIQDRDTWPPDYIHDLVD